MSQGARIQIKYVSLRKNDRIATDGVVAAISDSYPITSKEHLNTTTFCDDFDDSKSASYSWRLKWRETHSNKMLWVPKLSVRIEIIL